MIPLPNQPKLIQKIKNLGIFEIEGLYPGYGMTVGNALRRVLLSSLPGAALTQVKIKNVPHEFTAAEYVHEDMVQIILNLKKLRLKLYGDEPQRVTLTAKGEREVTGADFVTPSQVEIINKDLHIATLTDKKAEFELEALVERGLGYVPTESKQKEKGEIGTIFLDALFSPVQRVSFKVEHMRVGERTDFDRLHLEIETDGAMTPDEALRQSSEILQAHFTLLTEGLSAAKERPKTEEAEMEKGEVQEESGSENELLKKELLELSLSTRTFNALMNNKIKTLGGLLRKNEKSLLELEGMGEKGVEEVKKALKKLGLELKAE